jgi:branched-chain amino acid transport system permease protein
MNDLVSIIANGLALAAIYALVAVGFVIIFKATRVLNFAHGEFMALGAYFSYVSITTYSLPFVIGLTVGFLATSALGVLVFFLLMRPMLGEQLWAPVMVTVGLGIVLQSIIKIKWGAETLLLPVPVDIKGIDLPGTTTRISNFAIFSIIVAILFFIAVALFFRFASIGRQMRAAAENPLLASYSGVNINKIFAVGWGIAAFAAALAGVAQASGTLISAGIGAIALRAFPAALLGGMDSIIGAAVGAVIIGLVEMTAAEYLGSGSRDVVAFVVLLVVLMVRPYGLFGSREIERI